MSSEGPAPLPDHEQQAWDDIVARLGGTLGEPTVAPVPRQEFDPLGDEHEGFVPPEPPPLPRPSDAWAKAAWGAVAGGPALILISSVLGWDRIMSVMGMVITAAGFVGLIARMKDREDNGDDGAVV
jgi:hypothetical protein